MEGEQKSEAYITSNEIMEGDWEKDILYMITNYIISLWMRCSHPYSAFNLFPE